ncbi:MAG: hypothetical protein IH623_27590 [Verrucomicrobia bacterium]|nr:hypothetical protein [Verrucomicrobiota bacterium]
MLRNESEADRLSLERLAKDLGVQEHVVFFNRFVALEKLMQFIGAADIYLTPYLTGVQIRSLPARGRFRLPAQFSNRIMG